MREVQIHFPGYKKPKPISRIRNRHKPRYYPKKLKELKHNLRLPY